jgi:hypothetical protein
MWVCTPPHHWHLCVNRCTGVLQPRSAEAKGVRLVYCPPLRLSRPATLAKASSSAPQVAVPATSPRGEAPHWQPRSATSQDTTAALTAVTAQPTVLLLPSVPTSSPPRTRAPSPPAFVMPPSCTAFLVSLCALTCCCLRTRSWHWQCVLWPLVNQW